MGVDLQPYLDNTVYTSNTNFCVRNKVTPVSGLRLAGDLFEVHKTSDRDAKAILGSEAKTRGALGMLVV